MSVPPQFGRSFYRRPRGSLPEFLGQALPIPRFIGPRFAVLFCAAVALTTVGRAAPVTEYEVKAAFLYNFIQFVEWPKEALRENEPFVIGVLGRDPFGPALDELVSGESQKGRPIAVRRFRDSASIDSCHLLFVSTGDPAEVEEALTALRGRAILTVGESGGFLPAGGMVRFVVRDNRVRLQINAQAAKAAHLEISSKLLRLAEN